MVEDDHLLQKSLHRVLTEEKFTVCAFSDAESMLAVLPDKLQQDHDICILMDVHLGACTGIDAQKMVRQIDQFVPIVFMSAQQDAKNVNQAWRDGASDFLFKPFTPKELMTTLMDALAKRRALPSSGSSAQPVVSTELVQLASSLSLRQRQVLKLLVEGLTHQEIGERIGISARTVKLHRAALKQRLKSKNQMDLARIYEAIKHLLS